MPGGGAGGGMRDDGTYLNQHWSLKNASANQLERGAKTGEELNLQRSRNYYMCVA